MGIIKQLPEHIAIKIAAGEVVERPASVVKELVENALDAGATQVDISIKEGGKTLIEVKDNGSGMDSEDAQAAFLRHGTSKIRDADDLAHVTTLGFRGEALAAIGASAFVEVMTTQTGADAGTYVAVAYGEMQSPKPHPPLPGTTMRVSRLFDALPVRQKFLKSDVTEWKACLDIITRQLLAQPRIGFLVKHNDRVVYDVPAEQTFAQRVARIWKVDENNLVTVDYQMPHYDLQGVVGKPELAHEGKSRQFFAVNGHPVNDKMVMRAIREAFGSLLPPGLQPVYALNLTLHPGIVDVNIHPRKDEVRFVNSQEVYRFVLSSISQALDKVKLSFTQFAPSVPQAVESSYTPPHASSSRFSFSELRESREGPPSLSTDSFSFPRGQESFVAPSFLPPSQTFVSDSVPGRLEHSSKPVAPILVIDNCFLVTVHNEQLLLIDQHAAHERILYNQLWQNDANHAIPHQALLIPAVLELDEKEKVLIEEHQATFESIGFVFVVTQDELAVKEVPQLVKRMSPTQLIKQVLHGLQDERPEPELTDIKHKFFATMACKAAVKAGDILDDTEKRQLVTDLLSLPDIFTCPHGRPTHIEITGASLEKLFKRTGF